MCVCVCVCDTSVLQHSMFLDWLETWGVGRLGQSFELLVMFLQAFQEDPFVLARLLSCSQESPPWVIRFEGVVGVWK